MPAGTPEAYRRPATVRCRLPGPGAERMRPLHLIPGGAVLIVTPAGSRTQHRHAGVTNRPVRLARVRMPRNRVVTRGARAGDMKADAGGVGTPELTSPRLHLAPGRLTFRASGPAGFALPPDGRTRRPRRPCAGALPA